MGACCSTIRFGQCGCSTAFAIPMTTKGPLATGQDPHGQAHTKKNKPRNKTPSKVIRCDTTPNPGHASKQHGVKNLLTPCMGAHPEAMKLLWVDSQIGKGTV